jgi:arginine-tRNA-protein transferase
MNARSEQMPAVRLLLTGDYPCGYLPPRMARNLVVDPATVDGPTYNQLARLGFRRSGDYVYRPHCVGCQACLSLRVAAATFQPTRSQRRNWQRNQDLQVYWQAVTFTREHYRLFERYLHRRHPHGGMDNNSPDSYLRFIAADWSDTRLVEFRAGDRLLAVAVVDRLADGLSAVYTFYDLAEPPRGLGTYAILWQLAEARQRGLEWVYLGYWVAGCRRMAYKNKFGPHQVFRAGQWQAGSD